jgi:hypothetical protein
VAWRLAPVLPITRSTYGYRKARGVRWRPVHGNLTDQPSARAGLSSTRAGYSTMSRSAC